MPDQTKRCHVIRFTGPFWLNLDNDPSMKGKPVSGGHQLERLLTWTNLKIRLAMKKKTARA